MTFPWITRRSGALAAALTLIWLHQLSGADNDAALAAQARSALSNATVYLRSISTEGGYLWRYTADLKNRAGENIATPSQVWIQPPGTPSAGTAFLKAWEATRDQVHMEAARAAALALARGQLASGGWDYLIDFDPEAGRKWYRREDIGKVPPQEVSKRRNISTFDDNNTQSALRFLLAFCDAVNEANDPRDAQVHEALEYGLKKLLEAQYPNGAWPQRYDGQPRRLEDFPVKPASYPREYPRTWPNTDYKHHYTFNDNTHRDCIQTALDAYHRIGRIEYLDAAKRGGDFIVLAQMPEPQPAWAQQYNAQMEPAWARAFEPPCITGGESVGVIRTLMELYLETGEENYLKPIPSALAWFERSALAPNRWARYYELGTNKQIFGDRDGKIHYRLEDISEERQTGYSWSGDYGVRGVMADFEKIKKLGRDAVRNEAERKPRTGASQGLKTQVSDLIAAQDKEGRWMTRSRSSRPGWPSGEQVEISVFIRNMTVLAGYLNQQQ